MYYDLIKTTKQICSQLNTQFCIDWMKSFSRLFSNQVVSTLDGKKLLQSKPCFIFVIVDKCRKCRFSKLKNAFALFQSHTQWILKIFYLRNKSLLVPWKKLSYLSKGNNFLLSCWFKIDLLAENSSEWHISVYKPDNCR